MERRSVIDPPIIKRQISLGTLDQRLIYQPKDQIKPNEAQTAGPHMLHKHENASPAEKETQATVAIMLVQNKVTLLRGRYWLPQLAVQKDTDPKWREPRDLRSTVPSTCYGGRTRLE